MGQPAQSVSAAIICLNEERDLPECLASLAWCNEIVVVLDTRTTDRTQEIATAADAKVRFREWTGWSDQKNYAFEQCSGDWILSIDADERVPAELQEEILERVTSTRDVGYYVPRRNYWMGKWIRHGGWYPDYTLRLFRRGHGTCRYMVHERIEVDGSTRVLTNPLIHDNIRHLDEHLVTMMRASRAEALEMQANGARFYVLFPFKPVWAYLKELRRKGFHRLDAYLLAKHHFKNRVEIAWLLPFLPALKFFHMYVVKGGFRDGSYGFWLAVLSAWYIVMKYANFWASGVATGVSIRTGAAGTKERVVTEK
jgi:glycosyltransferase involved in cell wall biosynthesis